MTKSLYEATPVRISRNEYIAIQIEDLIIALTLAGYDVYRREGTPTVEAKVVRDINYLRTAGYHDHVMDRLAVGIARQIVKQSRFDLVSTLPDLLSHTDCAYMSVSVYPSSHQAVIERPPLPMAIGNAKVEDHISEGFRVNYRSVRAPRTDAT